MSASEPRIVTPISRKNSDTQESPIVSMAVDDEKVASIEEEEDTSQDTVEKLKNQDILPELFSLLRDLQTGAISAKDFDNHAGSLRLKLSESKVLLKQIPDIMESIAEREMKIEKLSNRRNKRSEMLLSLREKVNRHLDPQT